MRPLLPRRGLLAAPLILPAAALAQGEWPSRPVRIVVPYPPGGGLDVLCRAMADRLSVVWRQPVTVDNRPGGATIPGTDQVAKAAPDGHTLLMTSDSSITSNPHLGARLPHDPMRDLVPVSYLLDVHQMVLVHPSVGARDMAGLVAAAKAAPGRLNYGSYGPGSQPNLLFDGLRAREGTQIQAVTYRGVGPAVLATVQGEVQMTLSGIASSRDALADGRIVALAVGRPTRFPQLPDVPTLDEAGYGELDPRTWFGLFAPAGTPAALLSRIQRDAAAALDEPLIRDRHLTANGYTVHAATPEASLAMVAADFEAKRRLVRLAGVRAE
ncbi:Bug family tripartite tricarboxylate transporter substrate binding protein [Roseomonas sp. CCTCC AB2023176]|uniref:Bug family tripartite tricarboxylate transporter substrate binding protein n=1 Tax=Roseomonas sp. CCTCC AB2023176 TaxID=3342640 RepID=UPI0035DDD3EF